METKLSREHFGVTVSPGPEKLNFHVEPTSAVEISKSQEAHTHV